MSSLSLNNITEVKGNFLLHSGKRSRL